MRAFNWARIRLLLFNLIFAGVCYLGRGTGRWLTDVSPLLPLLDANKCTFTMKTPPWAMPWFTSLNLRFSIGNQTGENAEVSLDLGLENCAGVLSSWFDGAIWIYSLCKPRGAPGWRGELKMRLKDTAWGELEMCKPVIWRLCRWFGILVRHTDCLSAVGRWLWHTAQQLRHFQTTHCRHWCHNWYSLLEKRLPIWTRRHNSHTFIITVTQTS